MRRLILPLALGIVLTAIPTIASASTSVAFVDPDDGRWYVPHGSGSFTSFSFGAADDTPISGDWNCNGIDTPGRFRTDGLFYLRNAVSEGEPDITFHFGVPGDQPLVGDWNGDGCDTVAVYRASESTVYAADRLGLHMTWRSHPVAGTPIVGDFDGDNRDDVAGYRAGSGLVLIDNVEVGGESVAGLFYDGIQVRTIGEYAHDHALDRLVPVAGNFGPCAVCEDVRPALSTGDQGAWVTELRTRLAGLGYRPGNGVGYDSVLRSAVVTFEKYHGLERNGVFEADHWALLDKAVSVPFRADVPNRVEVDLGRQILILVREDLPAGIIPISSANGDTYTSWNGNTVTARTPEGDFEFYRSESGWYRSYLGGLYEPFFFRGGYAIHGSNSVPAYPASHGCIRTQIADQDWLKPQLELGMPIFVYGERTPAPATGNG
ncbi:MAG: L,D-transpeptidase family protein [Acidimicrobiia bacterium]|nr:L,D-transpeptidase family protein [Acidimicrobiia bacterium]